MATWGRERQEAARKAFEGGSDPIEVCALPSVDLYVDGEVLDNPKQVKAELKADLAAYNAKMLENMAEFFHAQVESQ
eukprot:COSAG06_NODE_30903_length_530_cov_0.979118_1_plen_76_part_01